MNASFNLALVLADLIWIIVAPEDLEEEDMDSESAVDIEYQIGETVFSFLWRLTMFTMNLIQTRSVLNKFQSLLTTSTDDIDAMTIIRQKSLDNMRKTDSRLKNDGLNMKHALKDDEAFELFVKQCSDGLWFIVLYTLPFFALYITEYHGKYKQSIVWNVF